MSGNTFFGSVLETSYSFYSTILLFGLDEHEKEALEDCLKNMPALDKITRTKRKLKVHISKTITDIYGMPYFMAFVNFENISEEDKSDIFEYFAECIEPISREFDDNNLSKDCLNSPVIYAINYTKTANEMLPSNIKFNNYIFDDKENLRLAILSEIKDNEGVGIACTNAIRIYRVLKMYKCLIDEGILTKKKTDALVYPDSVSQRMFYKDIRIIKEVEEGGLLYDRNLKGYILKKKKKER